MAGESRTLNNKTPFVCYSFVIQPFVGTSITGNYGEQCLLAAGNTILDVQGHKMLRENQFRFSISVSLQYFSQPVLAKLEVNSCWFTDRRLTDDVFHTCI